MSRLGIGLLSCCRAAARYEHAGQYPTDSLGFLLLAIHSLQSAEKCRRVARRMFFTTYIAGLSPAPFLNLPNLSHE